MSVTTDVERGLIGVGGGSFSLLLPRSADFSALGIVLKVRYPDPLVVGSMFGLFQVGVANLIVHLSAFNSFIVDCGSVNVDLQCCKSWIIRWCAHGFANMSVQCQVAHTTYTIILLLFYWLPMDHVRCCGTAQSRVGTRTL